MFCDAKLREIIVTADRISTSDVTGSKKDI